MCGWDSYPCKRVTLPISLPLLNLLKDLTCPNAIDMGPPVGQARQGVGSLALLVMGRTAIHIDCLAGDKVAIL